MTKTERFKLSLKGWKWLAFPALFFWIASACFLCSMCSEAISLHQQRSEPMILTAVALGGNAELQVLEKSQARGDILSWSRVYEISGTIQIMNYREECSVVGIDRELISSTVKRGGYYPENSGMPYLLVNEAFLKEMTDANGEKIEEPETIDWLTKTVTFDYGDDQSIVCQICGILKDMDENESPAVYISSACAKSILQTGEGIVSEQPLRIKIESAGVMEQVQTDLSGQGITVDNIDEGIIWTWKIMLLKMRGFCLTAVISGIAAWLLFYERLRIDALRNKEEYELLQELEFFEEKEKYECSRNMDVSKKNICRRMNGYRALWFCVIGFGLGLLSFICISGHL